MMKKSLPYISFVAAVALITGCGGSSGSTTPTTDTTAPTFTNTTYQFTVDEGAAINVTLMTNDAGATFSESHNNAVLSGSTLTFTAPQVDTDRNETVSITATDEAGNAVSKNFTFEIKDVPVFVAGYVAAIGDKGFVRTTDDLKGPSGLVWKDTIPDGTMSYSIAQTHCPADFRLPTPSEVLDIIDYSDNTIDINASLLDQDFTNNIVNDVNDNAVVSAIWVDTAGSGGNQHYVHLVGGIDALETNDLNHSVICVKGTKDNTTRGFTVDGNTITDTRTGYKWSKIVLAETSTYTDAAAECPTDFVLPSINELRSIYDYTNYSFPTEIVPAGVASIWSNTQDPKHIGQYYVIQQNGQDVSMNVGIDNAIDMRHVTCVQKPAQ